MVEGATGDAIAVHGFAAAALFASATPWPAPVVSSAADAADVADVDSSTTVAAVDEEEEGAPAGSGTGAGEALSPVPTTPVPPADASTPAVAFPSAAASGPFTPTLSACSALRRASISAHLATMRSCTASVSACLSALPNFGTSTLDLEASWRRSSGV